jgi:hypothetical protein
VCAAGALVCLWAQYNTKTNPAPTDLVEIAVAFGCRTLGLG